MQDVSRTFLGGSSTTRDKYRLFMDATLLQSFCDKLSESQEHVDQHQELSEKLLKDFE
jgi:hypothetical protein